MCWPQCINYLGGFYDVNICSVWGFTAVHFQIESFKPVAQKATWTVFSRGHFVPAVTLLREREAWWWQVNKGDAFWQQHLHSSPLIIPFITDECGCTDSTFLQAKWLLRCSLKLKYQNVVIWNLLGWFKHRNPSFQISGVIPVLTTSRCMWQWQQCYSPSYQLCHVRVFFFFF